MANSTLAFPADSVECLAGDYLLRRTDDGTWSVFLVEDLVLVDRLIPLKFERGTELMREADAMDSAAPARMGAIHVFGKEYRSTHANREDAVRAIRTRNLGEATPDVCRNIALFSRDKTSVVAGRGK